MWGPNLRDGGFLSKRNGTSTALGIKVDRVKHVIYWRLGYSISKVDRTRQDIPFLHLSSRLLHFNRDFSRSLPCQLFKRLLQGQIICGSISQILGFKLLIVYSIEKIHDISVHVLVVSCSVIVVFLELPEDFLYLFNGIAIGDHVIEKLEDFFIVYVPIE